MRIVSMVAALSALALFLIAGCKKSQQTVENSAPVVAQFGSPQPAKNPATAQAPPLGSDPTGASDSMTPPIAALAGRRFLIKNAGTLYAADAARMSEHKIADNVLTAALSGDGNLVAYADNQGLYVFRLLDGQSVSLARLSDGHVNRIAWSPDQRHVAYDVEDHMKSWDLFLASNPPNGEPQNLGHWCETLSFSPNGKFIVHPTLDTTKGARGNLETVNVGTGKRETIYEGTGVIWDAQYAPNGPRIAFLMTQPDPDAAGDSDDDMDCRGPDRDLWVLPLGSKKPQKIMEDVFHFEWSPNGRFLAIDRGTQDCGYPPGDGAVFISSTDGTVQFQLSRNAPSMGARFSPDSKQVLFVDSFHAERLVIGDLATRNLTPLNVSGCVGGECTQYDWK